MIRDKGGVWHGRFGDEVYYNKKDGGQGIRRMPKNANHPNSKEQKLWNVVFGKGAKNEIVCYIVNEKLYSKYIDKDKRQPYLPPTDWQAMTLSSAVLAISCGWKEPMTLIPNYGDLEPFRRKKPEVVWGDIVNGKMCLLIFTPSPRNVWSKIVRICARVWFGLNYMNIKKRFKLSALANWEVNQNDELSTERLSDFYATKAAEYLERRWGKWEKSYAKKMLRGARFTAFEFESFSAPVGKFLKEDVKFGDLSGGTAHIKVDMVGMKEQKYGDMPVHCALKSRLSDDFVIKLPQRKLRTFGKKLALHLRKIAKKQYREYLSDPQVAQKDAERHKKWQAENPDKMKESYRKYEAKRKIRMQRDPEYRKKRLASNSKSSISWQKKHPNRVKGYTKRYREKLKNAKGVAPNKS